MRLSAPAALADMTMTRAQRLAFAWLGLAVLGVLMLWLLSPVLMPFLVALVLAYMLEPPVEWLVRRRVPRIVAVLLVEFIAILVALAVVLLIVPVLSRQLPMLREQIPLLAERINHGLGPLLTRLGVEVSLDIESIKAFGLKYLDANIEEWLATALSSARIGGSILLAVIGNLVLVPMVLFFALLDWPRLMEKAAALIPPRMRESVDGFLGECDQMLGQYLRGQLMVMIVLAAFYSIGLALFGFDLALPIGVFTGLAVFIPFLGFGLGLVLALVAALLQFGSLYGLIAVAVVYGLGQFIESFWLTPRLVGERIGMSPLTVIFALLVFGHLFGFVGVLIALPVSAVLVVAFGRLRSFYLQGPLYNG